MKTKTNATADFVADTLPPPPAVIYVPELATPKKSHERAKEWTRQAIEAAFYAAAHAAMEQRLAGIAWREAKESGNAEAIATATDARDKAWQAYDLAVAQWKEAKAARRLLGGA